ncbi:hypothetical protein V6N12_027989 [Hibiscus sabdariffa]|uniref:Uncharacterized protein n=1 Tax=Hibiscus sabdariffa TaxID=183260 RepID=A0ABR2F4J7_9ROSI
MSKPVEEIQKTDNNPLPQTPQQTDSGRCLESQFAVVYLNDLTVVGAVASGAEEQQLGRNGTNGVENGAREIMVQVRLLSGQLDPLYMFLELPVVDEGVSPFWYQLSFKLL